MRRRTTPLLLALLLCIVACGTKREQDAAEPISNRPEQTSPKEIRATGIDRPAKPGLPTCVREPVRCNRDYLRFAAREHTHSQPVQDCEALYSELISQWQADLHPAPPVRSNNRGTLDLRSALIESLNIGFLLKKGAKGLRASGPQALVLREEDMGTYRRVDMVLRDRAVGDIPVLLAVPTSEGPFPVVLALPGHGQVPTDVLESLPPEQVTARGMALMVIGLRAYDSLEAEHDATLALLCQGFSLMGLRVYEALVTLEYIVSDSRLSADAVGLVGHSGGSATLNLLVWLSGIPRALITDLSTEYFNLKEFGGRYYVLDETHPQLHALAPQINALDALRLPILKVPYGAPGGPDPLLNFLGENLRKTP